MFSKSFANPFIGGSRLPADCDADRSRHDRWCMRKTAGSLEFTATDLVGFLNCRYLSYLDLAVVQGARSEPFVWDPMLKLLWERAQRTRRNTFPT